MKNLNYPEYKTEVYQISEIYTLLPKKNPYNDRLYILTYAGSSHWFLVDKNYYTTLKEYQKIGTQIVIAWSYMEILQWVRDNSYYIKVAVLASGEYIGVVEQFTEYEFIQHYKCVHNKFISYYEALDEAILFTLNLLKK